MERLGLCVPQIINYILRKYTFERLENLFILHNKMEFEPICLIFHQLKSYYLFLCILLSLQAYYHNSSFSRGDNSR